MENIDAIRLLLEESICNNNLSDFDQYISQASKLEINVDKAFFDSLSHSVTYNGEKMGVSLLGQAAYYGRDEIIQYLIFFFKQKIDVNLSNTNGNTALHLCVMGSHEEANKFHNHADTIDQLLAFGADIKQQNNDKLPPLQLHRSLAKSSAGSYTVESWLSDFFQTRDKVIPEKISRISTLLELAFSKQLSMPHNILPSPSKSDELTFEEFCILHAMQNNQAKKEIGFGFKSTRQLQRSIKKLSKERKTELDNLLTSTQQDEAGFQYSLSIDTISLPLLMTLIFDLAYNEPSMFSLIIATMSATIFFSEAEKLQIEIETESQGSIASSGYVEEESSIINEIENHFPFSTSGS